MHWSTLHNLSLRHLANVLEMPLTSLLLQSKQLAFVHVVVRVQDLSLAGCQQ